MSVRPPARVLRLLLALLLTAAVASSTLFAGTAEAAKAKPKPVRVSVMTTYTAPKSGEDSAAVKALQLRLVKVGVLQKKYVTSYFGAKTTSAVKAFQKSAGLTVNGKVGSKTWKTLVARSGTLTTTTSASVRHLPASCKVHGRVLCASKTDRTLYYLVDGTLVKRLSARFGCSWDSRRTREGVFHVFRKDRDHVSSVYHTAMPYSMFFSGGQAVHYSADFAARGYNGCSHGCVNLRSMAGISYLYSKIKIGDRVVVYRG